jgi:hypothetical protein
MKAKRTRSRGIRNPGRNAAISGVITGVSFILVALGAMEMRTTGRSGSPLLMLGLFPALLGPIFFIYYLSKIRVFCDLQSGRRAIARWTVTPEKFRQFCDEEQRVPAGSILTNFYQPPHVIPLGGVEVIFAQDGVLIGDGYFPLSTTGGRRVESVKTIASDPPTIEFGTVLITAVRTSSATTRKTRISEKLRVPVDPGALPKADEIVRFYQALIGRR